tara:strand:- start:1752 stop:2210 length:459 start_codon:yes stop_codon:yes gene_type:complete
MAIKVNYNSTQGLVQELDPTGAGGFLVNGSEIGQKTLTQTESNVTTANGAANVSVEVTTDVIFVNIPGTGPSSKFTLGDGSYFGQIVTIFLKSVQNAGDGGDSIHVVSPFPNNQFKTVNTTAISTTIQSFASIATSVRVMWIGDRWIGLNHK